MDAETAYRAWFDHHVKSRSGEDRRRLLEGHRHAERLFALTVWWPAFRNFRNLIPEYRVKDFNGGVRYIDFVFIIGGLRLAIEIDGFEWHVRRLDRHQFADHLNRQNHLVIDGWSVLRFAYNDMESNPRQCQQVLQQFVGQWSNTEEPRAGTGGLTLAEREILRLAQVAEGPISPARVSAAIGMGCKYSRKILHSMVERGYLEVASGRERARTYRLSARHLV